MLGDVFVLVIITVIGLVFASVIDGEFLIRGDVVEPFAIEHTAIFVMCSLDLISLLVQKSGLALIRSSRLMSFRTKLRARWYDNFDQNKVLSVTYKIWIHDVSPDQSVSQGDALVPVMRVLEFRWSYDPELSKNIFTCYVVYASYI